MADISKCAGAGAVICQQCRRRTEASSYVQSWIQGVPQGDCTAPWCSDYLPPHRLTAGVSAVPAGNLRGEGAGHDHR